ncbi:MAG TPA: TetR/AcrR family transcriptional regulator [Candidatus Baltobacteraceae bacterium]|nr:TetR/AcrR family transcriptional regulator [Candidatus Baltobacteraceae bacterium]
MATTNGAMHAVPLPPRERLYRGRSSTERRAERRGRLLAVGLDLFGTRGFAKTTIPMICSTAGVTARHFYEEFASREALLRAVYEAIADAANERAIEALRRMDLTVRERIAGSNAGFFGYLTSDRRIARIYALESSGVSHAMELLRLEKREALAEKLTRAMNYLERRGVLHGLDSRLIAAAIGSAARDLVTEWVLAQNPPTIEKMADTVATIWIRVLELDRFEVELS